MEQAKFTAIKHHWWWKANFVFDHVPVLANHPGPKIFFEEDHMFAPDMIEVSQLMNRHMAMGSSNCVLFSLGTYTAKSGATDTVGDAPFLAFFLFLSILA